VTARTTTIRRRRRTEKKLNNINLLDLGDIQSCVVMEWKPRLQVNEALKHVQNLLFERKNFRNE